MIGRLTLFAVLFAATGLGAEAPENSIRPTPRGSETVLQPVQATPSGAIERPSDAVKPRGGLFKSMRPLFRSRKVENEARAQQRLRKKGAVCGDPALQGKAVGRVTGKLRGCVIENAVQVRSVSGVSPCLSMLML